MGRVFLSWIYTILIGSLLIGLVAINVVKINPDKSLFLLYFLAISTAIFMSFLWALPLLIVELITLKVLLNSTKRFSVYSISKYTAAILTIIIMFVYHLSDNPNNEKERFQLIWVVICYGTPGFLFHFYYIRSLFSKQRN